MARAKLFKTRYNQGVRLPKGYDFEGVSEVEVRKEGNSIILTPVRKNWIGFANTSAADDDFLMDRKDIIEDGRVTFDG